MRGALPWMAGPTVTLTFLQLSTNPLGQFSVFVFLLRDSSCPVSIFSEKLFCGLSLQCTDCIHLFTHLSLGLETHVTIGPASPSRPFFSLQPPNLIRLARIPLMSCYTFMCTCPCK